LIWLYRRCHRILSAITIVRPETVLRWHRMGFVAYWRWKSRSPGGRPRIAKEVRDLIRRMSLENPFWGATKIHGELLKLGIQVAQSTVSIYMVPRPDRPLQTWKTFVRNHMEGIASIDLFVVPNNFSHFWFSGTSGGVCWGSRSPPIRRRVAGAPDHRSVSLGHCTEISHS